MHLFADDCILYRTIHTPNDCSKLQDDLATKPGAVGEDMVNEI